MLKEKQCGLVFQFKELQGEFVLRAMCLYFCLKNYRGSVCLRILRAMCASVSV